MTYSPLSPKLPLMNGIDFSQWPVWVVALLLILNLFKSPLSTLFPVIFGFLTTKAQIAELQAEGYRQDEVAEKLMLASLVQQSLDQNRELIDFLRSIVVTRLDIMNERLIDITNEYQQMRQVYEKVVNGD